MRAALIDAIVALDEAYDALGRVRIDDVTENQREQIGQKRLSINVLADNLASDLDEDEHDRLDHLLSDDSEGSA